MIILTISRYIAFPGNFEAAEQHFSQYGICTHPSFFIGWLAGCLVLRHMINKCRIKSLFYFSLVYGISTIVGCLDYVLRTSIDKIKENGFELTKKRSRRYPATTITDADYADDIAILANTPDQAETLLHSLERAAASIGLYVNCTQNGIYVL